MTREEIIRIAEEAGILVSGDGVFALCERVAAAERERCAKVCDARALKNEQECDGADADDIASLRSAAWQISVCAAEIRGMK